MVGHEGGVAVGNGDMHGGVFHFLDGLHVIAQLCQRAVDQQRLEGFFGQRAFERLHLDALAGQVGGAGRGGSQSEAQESSGKQGTGEMAGCHHLEGSF